MRVLVLNPGSSTLKAGVIEAGSSDPRRAPLAETTIEWLADADSDGDGEAIVRLALEEVGTAFEAVGYRVVHGGALHESAAPVDGQLIAGVEELDELAPLHNRRAATVMRAGLKSLPMLPHVACFDTAFHATLPESVRRYPLPAEWVERYGLRRFGFHGLSVAWSVRRTAALLGRPPNELDLVVAHLGSGCSVTAVSGGRSVDTSMGFTPLEGLMMGTRAGSVDPGMLLHLSANGVSHADLADGLARRSGLLAVGGTSDVRELQRRADAGDLAATLALEMFARRAAAGIAVAASALDRVDAVVFTGGIGAHASAVRSAIVDRLWVLGIAEALAKDPPDSVLHPGPPAVVTVLAREDAVIADEVAALLQDESPTEAMRS